MNASFRNLAQPEPISNSFRRLRPNMGRYRPSCGHIDFFHDVMFATVQTFPELSLESLHWKGKSNAQADRQKKHTTLHKWIALGIQNEVRKKNKDGKVHQVERKGSLGNEPDPTQTSNWNKVLHAIRDQKQPDQQDRRRNAHKIEIRRCPLKDMEISSHQMSMNALQPEDATGVQ